MARQKTIKAEEEQEKTSWGESYTSLILGMIVVGVIGFIIFSFVNNNGTDTSSTSDESTFEDQNDGDERSSTSLPRTYTIKEGDDLWSISEEMYESGYNWVDIAQANNLENPNVLFVGNELTIPDVEPKKPTIAGAMTAKGGEVENPIITDSYTVEKGDHLWDIAVRAYNDGYKWVDIAEANDLANPNLIFTGTKLKIPR